MNRTFSAAILGLAVAVPSGLIVAQGPASGAASPSAVAARGSASSKDPELIGSSESPKVVGTRRVGRTIRVTDGTWNTEGLTFTYQWFMDDEAVPGATKNTYALGPSDRGHYPTATVTATKGDRFSSSTTGRGRVVGSGITNNTGIPTVTGTAKVGRTLTASHGTWDQSGLTYRYQWLRHGDPIKGATHRTYKITRASKGEQLRVLVTAKKPYYLASEARSAKTAEVTG